MDMNRNNPAAKPLSPEDGFSLLEILMAVAVFAIGVLGIAGLQVQATNKTTHSRLFTEAYTVACDQIEAIYLMPYTDANITAGTHTVGNTGPGNRYNLSYTVTDNLGPTPPANTKTITVTVSINASSLLPVTITFTKAQIQDIS